MTSYPAGLTGANGDVEQGSADELPPSNGAQRSANELPLGDVDRKLGAKPRPAPSRTDSRTDSRAGSREKPRLRLPSASLLPGSPADDPRAWGGQRLGNLRNDDPDLDSMACDYLAERPPHHDR